MNMSPQFEGGETPVIYVQFGFGLGYIRTKIQRIELLYMNLLFCHLFWCPDSGQV